MDEGDDEGRVYWIIDNVNMWQQIDRRIDECAPPPARLFAHTHRCNEVIWSYYFANRLYFVGPAMRDKRFRTHLSMRAIRPRPEDEFQSFAKWVAREPVPSDFEDDVA